MARTSYQNLLALPDAAQQWNFDLFFPSIPGSSGTARNITYKVRTTSLPSSKIETVPIELHGAKKQEAGRATYDHTFSCTIMETVDYQTYLTLRAWRDYMRSWKNNTGTDSTAYKVNLELDVYDNQGNVSQTFIVAGSFLTDIGDIGYDGAQGGAVIDLQLTFSFDYISDGKSW
jgi:hypothetical protein